MTLITSFTSVTLTIIIVAPITSMTPIVVL